MPRFSTSDQEQLHDLKQRLSTVRTDGPRILEAWLPDLCQLLGLEMGVIYNVRQDDESLRLDDVVMARMHSAMQRRLVHEFDGMLRATPRRFSVYNPARPEPAQRNRAMAFHPRTIEQLGGDDLHRLGVEVPTDVRAVREGLGRMIEMLPRIGIADHWHLRALVCKGDSLLAWVGGFRVEQPGKREERLLNHLVPALHRRLVLDQMLDRAPILEATLDAALEQIPHAAFLADAHGAVLLVNSAGRGELERSPRQTRGAIADALGTRQRASAFDITPIVATGRAPVFLLIAREKAGIAERLAAIARRWELTPRQGEVLALVAHGEANRSIATKLECGERTVEMHVTALLLKAQVESRAALIARFFLGD